MRPRSPAENEDELPPPKCHKRETQYWVRAQDSSVAFKVNPESKDIDGLEKAIKVELGTDYTGNAGLQ